MSKVNNDDDDDDSQELSVPVKTTSVAVCTDWMYPLARSTEYRHQSDSKVPHSAGNSRPTVTRCCSALLTIFTDVFRQWHTLMHVDATRRREHVTTRLQATSLAATASATVLVYNY